MLGFSNFIFQIFIILKKVAKQYYFLNVGLVLQTFYNKILLFFGIIICFIIGSVFFFVFRPYSPVSKLNTENKQEGNNNTRHKIII